MLLSCIKSTSISKMSQHVKHQDNINHLSELLRQHHAQLQSETDLLLTAMAGEDVAPKKQHASKTASAISNITQLLPENQIPKWAVELRNTLYNFSRSQAKGPEVLKLLIKLRATISDYNWMESGLADDGIDFEKVFEACREQSKIPDLFDSIIDLLEQIRDSEEIDSRIMVEALTKLIATMRIGKKSTCLSLDGAWEFLLDFIQNYFWAEAKKIPGIGSLVEALEKTISETGKEMSRLQNEVRAEMASKVATEVKALKNHEPKLFSTYGKFGHLLASESTSTQSYEV